MRRVTAALAAVVAILATLFIAAPEASAGNRYPICVQSTSSVRSYAYAAGASWNTKGTYWKRSTNCTGRQAMEIQVTTAKWGRNGVLGRAKKYYNRDGQHAYFCKVTVNRSYPNSGSRKYQRTIAHEIGHCLQVKASRGAHWGGATIMNPYRYSSYPSSADHRYLDTRWAKYYRYGR